MNSKYKAALLVCLAMVLLSMIPQIHLWLVRGMEWNGAYVIIQGDEPYYSAYINSLLDGRTRRNDPYGAKDDTAAAPLPESTFSIQFIPAYVISSIARLFRASASTAMIAVIAVAAALAALAVFWLLNLVTDDYRLAAAGTLFVLCFGGLAGGHALVGLLIKTTDLSMPSLPFLRRYQPAAAFPLLILFVGLVSRAFTNPSKRTSVSSALLAGLTLAALIFSYLYLWTAAAAWLVCFSVLWLLLRAADRMKLVATLGIIAAFAAAALAPYAYLVSQRPASLDEQQTLHLTHRPDLFRIPEILGALILIGLVVAIARHRIERNQPRVIFTASLAVLPLVIFNQQILTGRSMQPYHFAAFVTNYMVLIALMIGCVLWWKSLPRRVLVWMMALSFAWGVVEVGLPSRLNTVPAAVVEDQMIPALLRLKQLSREDGTIADLRSNGAASTVLFSPQIAFNAIAPTWTPQGTLPDAAGIDFGHISLALRKEYFYMHLYYARADVGSLREALRGNPNDPVLKYYARSAFFGHDRIVPALAAEFKPIQEEEIEREIRTYQDYAKSFSRAQALKRPLSYVVTQTDGNFDFTNIDLWYERDAGERAGAYTLYRVKLRELR
jgi:MFS family permease